MLLTVAQVLSQPSCVPLALPVYMDVSQNREKPVSKPYYTGTASGTQNTTFPGQQSIMCGHVLAGRDSVPTGSASECQLSGGSFPLPRGDR